MDFFGHQALEKKEKKNTSRTKSKQSSITIPQHLIMFSNIYLNSP